MGWDPAKHPRGHHGLFVGALAHEAEHALTEADRKAERATSAGDAKRAKDLKRLGLDKLSHQASGIDQSFRARHHTEAHKEALRILGPAASKPGAESLIAAYMEAQGTLTGAQELSRHRHAYVDAIAEKLKQPGLSVHDRAVLRSEIKHNTVSEQNYAEQLPRLEASAERARKRLSRAANARSEVQVTEWRAQMSTQSINDLPDSDFAYIEPGGHKDSSGKTVPRSKRHFPIHDADHVRNALARAPQSPFGKLAMPKIMAAAKKFGITMSDDHMGAGRSYDDKEGGGMAAVERRFTLVTVEARSGADGEQRIGGYAAMFNKPSQNLGGFVETVERSFFNKSRGDGWPDVMCRYNHDDNMLLGTTGARTLRLSVDETGLDYDCLPPKSRADVVELVQRGDVRKSSFAFRVPAGGEDWGLSEQGYPMRHLLTGQLVDVAPVNVPAYTDTAVGLRSLDPAEVRRLGLGPEAAYASLARRMDADFEEVRAAAEENELHRFFRVSSGAPMPVAKPKPKKLGAAALLELLERRSDPYLGE